MNKDKLLENIKQLNKAWKMIRKAIAIIEGIYKKDKDVEYFLWKFGKANDKLNSFIYKKIQQEHVDEEFNKMMEKLKEEENE